MKVRASQPSMVTKHARTNYMQLEEHVRGYNSMFFGFEAVSVLQLSS